MAEQDDKQRELDHLITQMREGSNAEALKAVDELRERGWLIGSSLSGFFDISIDDLTSDNFEEDTEFFRDANLFQANLSGANLRGANLADASLMEVNLSGAKLDGAFLSGANLRRASLRNASLHDTDLVGANLSHADMYNADLTGATCRFSVFTDVDLSTVKGLENVTHSGPSSIGVDTLYKSKGKIPEAFLRGCGVPKEFIEFTTGLFDEQAIRFNNCFISYRHKDIGFARKLYQELFDAGVTTWIDFDKLKGGDFWADVINQAIHHYEKLVVCCSKNSLHSLGVDREINTALRIEERIYQQSQEKVSIVIPVDMDGYIYQCDNHVARRLQERHIVDARHWESDFESVLSDVIKALRTDEGRETPPEGKL